MGTGDKERARQTNLAVRGADGGHKRVLHGVLDDGHGDAVGSARPRGPSLPPPPAVPVAGVRPRPFTAAAAATAGALERRRRRRRARHQHDGVVHVDGQGAIERVQERAGAVYLGGPKHCDPGRTPFSAACVTNAMRPLVAGANPHVACMGPPRTFTEVIGQKAAHEQRAAGFRCGFDTRHDQHPGADKADVQLRAA